MRFGNLIFGVALILVAATLALVITFRGEPAAEPVANSADQAPGDRLKSRSKLRPDAARGQGARPRTARPQRSRAARPSFPKVEDLDLVLDESASRAPLTVPQRQTIRERLPAVKRASLARLQKMTERLDLTPAQQHKIYPQLVRSTNGYHEAMVVNYPPGFVLPPAIAASDTAQRPDEAIHEVLDPEQKDEFIEEKIDERAWWNEIVAQLEEDFDAAVGTGQDPVAAGQAAPEDKTPTPSPNDGEPAPSSEQGSNVFDLLNR